MYNIEQNKIFQAIWNILVEAITQSFLSNIYAHILSFVYTSEPRRTKDPLNSIW